MKLALLHFREEVQARTVLLLCDNATAVAYLRKEGGTLSRNLCLLSWEILNLCQVWGTHLLVRHIPSRLNVLADSLSRSKPLSTEWQLDPLLFIQLHRLLSTLSVDLFATCQNTQLPRFLSPFPDMKAEGWRRFPIRGSSRACCMRFCRLLLTAVLGRIRDSPRPVLLLAPAWPRQPWYSSLIELSIAHAVRLPLEQYPLLQGNWTHPSSCMFNLHAWTLCGRVLEDRDFLHDCNRNVMHLQTV